VISSIFLGCEPALTALLSSSAFIPLDKTISSFECLATITDAFS
jgi:hypothetical protein